jgi:hypothetical protein
MNALARVLKPRKIWGSSISMYLPEIDACFTDQQARTLTPSNITLLEFQFSMTNVKYEATRLKIAKGKLILRAINIKLRR